VETQEVTRSNPRETKVVRGAADQSAVCRMRRATWLLFASSLLLVQRILVTRAQRTSARQGVNRETSTVNIPSQGTVLGKEVRYCTSSVVIQS